ncbi:dihydrolipoamide acetyltransferase family protein [Rhodococcus aerolatus]
MLQTFPMPDAGEGLTEADVLGWRVAVGDEVTVNQVIVEIETAKAAVELPSPYAGTVRSLLVAEGDTVAVGAPIIEIDTGGGAPPADDVADDASDAGDEAVPNLVGYGPRSDSVVRRRRPRRTGTGPVPSAAAAVGEPTAGVSPAEPAPAAAPVPTEPVQAGAGPTGAVPLAKPPVRKLARSLGVDLRTVTPSGPGGVITRDDVHAATAPAPAPAVAGERRVPMSGVRRRTAEAMSRSAFTAPHVTEFLTVDITPTMELRERLRSSFVDGPPTVLAFAARAVCLAARRTPDVVARLDPDTWELVHREHLGLGIAAATPRGLVVPVVADADTLDLAGLTTALRALTVTAREGRTSPAEMSGGSITITNVGVFGVDTGTPILNPGETAILALGAVKQAPWVVDGALAVRQVCTLALSFDHRVVDGAEGSRFLADVGALLADPALALTY